MSWIFFLIIRYHSLKKEGSHLTFMFAQEVPRDLDQENISVDEAHSPLTPPQTPPPSEASDDSQASTLGSFSEPTMEQWKIMSRRQ